MEQGNGRINALPFLPGICPGLVLIFFEERSIAPLRIRKDFPRLFFAVFLFYLRNHIAQILGLLCHIDSFFRLFSILFLPKRLHLFRHFLICQQIFHQMSNAPVSLLAILSTPHNRVFHTIYSISTVTGFNGYSILMSPHENV